VLFVFAFKLFCAS